MTHLNMYLKIESENSIYFLNPSLIESVRQLNNNYSEIKMNSGVIYNVLMTAIEIGNSLLNKQFEEVAKNIAGA